MNIKSYAPGDDEKICLACGDTFRKPPLAPNQRAISADYNWQKRLYCSADCNRADEPRRRKVRKQKKREDDNVFHHTMPRRPQAEIEAMAICDIERKKGKIANLHDIGQDTLNRWVINFLRHNFFKQYKKILASEKHYENPHEYLKVFCNVMETIMREYPHLRTTGERLVREKILAHAERISRYESWAQVAVVYKNGEMRG